MTKPPSPAPASIGLGVFWHAARNPPSDPKDSFIGKTVLITGANVGLGLEAATKFATLGASTLILGVRSLERGKAAKRQIEQITHCKTNVIQLVQIDMGDFNSIEKFAKEVNNRFEKLDIAVLNAGVAVSRYDLSGHGYEMSVQVNVLSTTYLGILLLPRLRSTASVTGVPSLLEFVASTGHVDVAVGSVEPNSSQGVLARVNDRANFSVLKQYQISKLLEMWAAKQVAARTSVDEVIVVASCPGLCRSNLGRDFSLLMRLPDAMFKRIFGRSAEEGSRTIVSATALGKDAHGGFWTNDQITP